MTRRSYFRISIGIFFIACSTSGFAEIESKIWNEVTVFGLREHEASLPGSGDKITVGEIRNQSYDDINDILRKVPGVYLRGEDGYGLFPNISLRGSDPARSQKVTLMEDGILTAPAPYSAPAAYYSPTAGRMSSIEVLKGSSQIKYGPHTTGGVVNYVSTPIPHERKAYLKTLGGTDNEYRIHGYFGDTIETLQGRFGVLIEQYYRQTEGFKTIDSTPDFAGGKTGFEKSEPMVKFAWEPNSDSRYQRLEAKFGYTEFDADETYLGLSESDFEVNPNRRYAGTRFANIDTEHVRSYLTYLTEVTDNTQMSITGYYNKFQRNWFKLQSVLGGSESNLSEALAAGGRSLNILKGHASGTLRYRNNNRHYELYGLKSDFNHDFEVSDTQHALEWGLGYHMDYVRRNQNHVDYVQDENGVITSVSTTAEGTAGNRRQDSSATVMYIKDKVDWGDFTVTPGVRYEHVSYEFVDFNTSGSPDTITDRGKSALDAVAGGVGINYQVTDQLATFGGIHQGFSVPGPIENVNNNIKEEKSFTKELGVRLSDSKVYKVELVYFHTDFDDLLVPDNIGGAGTGESENVGDVITQGVEMKTEYDLGAALDKDFKNPYYVVFTYTNAELDGNSNSEDPESIFSGGQDGNKVPYVPDFQFSLGTGLEWNKVGVYLDATYVGETFSTASNNEGQVRPDGTPDARFGKTDEHIILDISSHYKITENLKAMINLQNITNESYVVSRHPHGPRPGRPFTFLLGLEMDF